MVMIVFDILVLPLLRVAGAVLWLMVLRGWCHSQQRLARVFFRSGFHCGRSGGCLLLLSVVLLS